MAESSRAPIDAVVSLLRRVSSTPGGAFVVVDPSATILFASPRLLMMLGHDDDALVETDFRDLVYGDLPIESDPLPFGVSETQPVQLLHSSGVLLVGDLSIASISGLDVGAWVVTIRSSEADGGYESQLRDELVVEQYCHSLSTDLVNTSTSADIADRLQQACGEIGELTNSHTVSVALDRPEREPLEIIGSWIHPDYLYVGPAISASRSEGLQWRDAVLGRVFVIDDVTKPPYGQLHALRRIRDLSALLTVPFRSGNQRGVLALTRRSAPHHWRLFDGQLARSVSLILGGALHRARIEQLWKLTYELGPIGFSIRTVEGHLVECNQQYLDLYGLDATQTEDVNIFDRVHPDDLDGLRARLAQLESPDEVQVTHQLRVTQADGGLTHLSMTILEVNVPGQSDPLRLTAVQRDYAGAVAS